MNKNEATELLNKIVASCPTLSCNGFYTREIRSSSTGSVELRLLASLDKDSRKTLNSILSDHNLKMEEEKDLLIIY
jgi:hypothetical protein